MWAREVAKSAHKNGHKPSFSTRPKPLRVSGVGNGAQMCKHDCKLPVALKQVDHSKVSIGNLTIPTVCNSELPGLLGLTALRNNRAILDFSTLQLHFCGPGDYDLNKALPPGTDSFQCELAPSGHMVLPCCEYDADNNNVSEHSLTLVTQRRGRRRVPPPPEAPPQAPHVPETTLEAPVAPPTL